MTLYEINRAIEALFTNSVDPETGELIIDEDAFDALQMAREEKIENTILLLKNVRAEIKAIKDEEKSMESRLKSKEALAERLEYLVRYATNGERFETARAAAIFKKTPVRAEIAKGCEEQFIAWAKNGHEHLLRIKAPEPDKIAIKTALQLGEKIPFALLTSGVSMTIK